MYPWHLYTTTVLNKGIWVWLASRLRQNQRPSQNKHTELFKQLLILPLDRWTDMDRLISFTECQCRFDLSQRDETSSFARACPLFKHCPGLPGLFKKLMKRSGFHNFSRDQLACVEIDWRLLCCLWRNSRKPVGGSTGQYNFLLAKTFVLICPETENCGKISSLPQSVAGQTRKMKTKSRVNNEQSMSKKKKKKQKTGTFFLFKYSVLSISGSFALLHCCTGKRKEINC